MYLKTLIDVINIDTEICSNQKYLPNKLNKWAHLCNCTQIKTEHYQQPRNPTLCSFLVPSPYPQGNYYPYFQHHRLIWSVLEHCVPGIIQYVFFFVWHLTPNFVFERFILFCIVQMVYSLSLSNNIPLCEYIAGEV